VNCRGGCFEVGMKLYGREVVVLRWWNMGIQWGTRGRWVCGNLTKTELLGLYFCW